MKVIAVYLTDVDREQPAVAAFPAPLTDETRARIEEFLSRVYPGRSYELREEHVEARRAPRLN